MPAPPGACGRTGCAGRKRGGTPRHNRVLSHTGWAIAGKGGAAEILDLPASTLRSRMKKLGIPSATSEHG